MLSTALISAVCALLKRSLFPLLIFHGSADPFAEAGDNDDSGKDYVHIRVQQRNGRKSLTTIQVPTVVATVGAVSAPDVQAPEAPEHYSA